MNKLPDFQYIIDEVISFLNRNEIPCSTHSEDTDSFSMTLFSNVKAGDEKEAIEDLCHRIWMCKGGKIVFTKPFIPFPESTMHYVKHRGISLGYYWCEPYGDYALQLAYKVYA